MPIAITAILIIVGTVGAVALAVGVVALLGFMTYDVVKSRGSEAEAVETAVRRHAHEAAERRIYLERGVARAFVILGGVFWVIAAFAGLYAFNKTGMGAALLAACVPLFAAAVTLVVGWYWERLAAAMLAVASAGVILWGVLYQFEIGVWILMTLALIGPMMTASVLFWTARREQEALELSLAQPELAVIPARSR